MHNDIFKNSYNPKKITVDRITKWAIDRYRIVYLGLKEKKEIKIEKVNIYFFMLWKKANVISTQNQPHKHRNQPWTHNTNAKIFFLHKIRTENCNPRIESSSSSSSSFCNRKTIHFLNCLYTHTHALIYTMACALSGNGCSISASARLLFNKSQQLKRRQNLQFGFRTRASAEDADDCNTEECAPDKEVVCSSTL